MAGPVIRAEQLGRVFDSVRALDGLDLDVPPGIVFGFLGPNGAGKTTTIRLLLGLLEPSSGRATVLGYDTRRQGDRIRERSGALLEHPGLYERLSAEDNLAFYARAWKLDRVARDGRIRELLEPLGLWERRGEAVGQWSRGMKQKLAVARALLHRPSLLFLDEPTASLDPVAAASLRDDLGRMVSREGTTVFLTTHNLVEAERLCQRVAVIKQGRLLAVGHPDELKVRNATRAEITGRGFSDSVLARLRERAEVSRVDMRNGRLVLELAESAEVAPLVTLLVESGAAVEEVRKDRGSLEDVFLTLMEEDR
ncbi:MAG: ABC transporter ATP-binding protein [Acidobacteria bacterium]|nr:ABC transporter ATP-binding protein [Acidobacteriota bacterium]